MDSHNKTKKKVAVLVSGTNIHFVLLLRFITKFYYLYTGDSEITFFTLTDRSPLSYLRPKIKVKYIFVQPTSNTSNIEYVLNNLSKIKYSLSKYDQVVYFDSATNIVDSFDDTLFASESLSIRPDNVWGGSSQDFISACENLQITYTTNPELACIPTTQTKELNSFIFNDRGGFTEHDIVATKAGRRILRDIRSEKGYVFDIAEKAYQYYHIPSGVSIVCES